MMGNESVMPELRRCAQTTDLENLAQIPVVGQEMPIHVVYE